MKVKTLVGIAVAGALSTSYGAMAGNFGHMGNDSTYGVVTPFSPNEAGPAALPHGERYALIGEQSHSAGIAGHEIATPLASNEAGPNEPIVRQQRADRFHTVRASGSMANPQTPWSPNEGGLNTFNEDMQQQEMHVAEVERAHIAAAEWNANLASAGSGYDATASVSEPAGSTSGIGLQGSNERFVDPPQAAPALRSEAGMPSAVERSSAMRPESEQALTVYEYNTVGILEVPTQPSEHTVWSVEPLHPGADLTRGSTVYLVPHGDVAIESGSPLGASGDLSAGATDGEMAERSGSSSL